MMRTVFRLATAILTVALLASPATRAADNEFGILVGGAWGDDSMVGPSEDHRFNPLLGIRYGHAFSEHWGMFADVTWVPYQAATVDGNVDLTNVRIGAEWLVGVGAGWRFFVAAGVGGMNGHPDVSENFTRPLGSLGVGFRKDFDDASLRIESRVEEGFGDNGLGGENLTNTHLLLGVAWGAGAPPKDSDGDGVVDKKDRCPGTPAGATVDPKGCPSDTDGDGVFDGLDACPDTPKGWPVDAKGCPTDADGDGVADGADACPGTPRGATVDAKGCPQDSDQDGVYDGLDRCPGTPRGVKVDASGCPLDSDGDGVNDAADRCPNTPRGVGVDASGCPLPPPPPPRKTAALFTETKKTLVLEGVTFETASAKLTPDSQRILDRVAESLVEWTEIRVEVGGHTDDRGAAAFNQKLSESRANAVRDYLASRGVDRSRMTAKGFGEASPVADNKTEAGRKQNRRVELTRLD